MDDPWQNANELHEKAHRHYQALKAGAHHGVSHQRLKQLHDEWHQAHRAWWDEVQRLIGAP